MELFDTHCHLDFNAFDIDRDHVIKKSKQHGVKHILIPAISKKQWHKTISLSQDCSICYLALGLHPMFIEEHQPQHLNELDELVAQHKPLAIGEIGLDFYDKHRDNTKEKQTIFFSKQLIIAKQHNLPVIIHNRKAHDLCLNLLKEHDIDSGIIHAFNGSIQQAEKYIELGCKLGFGGMLTYERSNKLRQLAKHLPLESIVLETDAPDMTVSQHSGNRNSPEYIPYIAQSLAQITQRPVEQIAKITTKNAKSVLRI